MTVGIAWLRNDWAPGPRDSTGFHANLTFTIPLRLVPALRPPLLRLKAWHLTT